MGIESDLGYLEVHPLIKDELGALASEVTKEKRMGGMKEQVRMSRSVSDGSLGWRRSFTHAVRRDPQGNCTGPQMCFTGL